MINTFFRNIIFKGQSLIEITVALGALSILLTVSSIAIITAINNTQESKYQNQASTYAQQGIDILRQMRDSSWSNFDSLSGSYCMAATCNQLTASGSCGRKGTSCGINVENFSREVLLQRNAAQCRVGGIAATRAVVTVAWIDSKCAANTYCRKVNLETCFSNIYGDSVL